MEHKPVVALDPAAELAQRVRKSAGVTLAVPIQHHASQPSPIASTPPQSIHSFSSASSAASTPPPSTPPTSFAQVNHHAATVLQQQQAPPTNGILPRPKTSHTTIERRYRTNLNARIQALRMAVPALRVLEGQSDAGGPTSGGSSRKVKVKIPVGKVPRVKRDGIPSSVPGDEDEFDVVDERGFVDGVKVARKCSKANVLGKAVEYIRVLKKREARLKREQTGLKSLVTGLVGGAALLNTWEKEWKDKFGGSERDEITEDDIASGGGEVADSDDDDDDDDDEGDGERRRKKVKINPPQSVKKEIKEKKGPTIAVSTQPMTVDGIVPEKRKRGRPRKTPLPATPVYAQEQPSPTMVQAGGPSQYLLATFALFSFFNSPLTSSYSPTPSTHTGSVLSNASTQVIPPTPSVWEWGWRDLIQVFHLFVSFCVFASIVLPWLPGKLKITSWKRFPLYSGKSLDKKPTHTTFSSSALIDALAKKGQEDEKPALEKALGGISVLNLLPLLWRRPSVAEGKAWVRLAELLILEGKTPLLARLTTSFNVNSYLSRQDKTADHFATLAMLLHPLGQISQIKVSACWEEAKSLATSSYEKLVLESLSVEEAIACLPPSPSREGRTPIEIIASRVVKDRVRNSLEKLFVSTVFSAEECASSPEVVKEQEMERKKTIAAAKSLGGTVETLGNVLEHMWSSSSDEKSISSENEEIEEDLKSLITAISLFRTLFPPTRLSTSSAALLSPPPSPSSTPRMSTSGSRGRETQYKHLLKRVLGSSVFERGDDEEGRLEDARDFVVDLLGDWERNQRRK